MVKQEIRFLLKFYVCLKITKIVSIMLSKKKGFVNKRNMSQADAMKEMKYKGDLRPNIKGKKKSSENPGDTLVAKTEHGREINIKRNQVIVSFAFFNFMKIIVYR